MNYQMHYALRQDIAGLMKDMDALDKKIRLLEKRYRWDTRDLTKALAGQLLRQAVSQFHYVHKHIWELDMIFMD